MKKLSAKQVAELLKRYSTDDYLKDHSVSTALGSIMNNVSYQLEIESRAHVPYWADHKAIIKPDHYVSRKDYVYTIGPSESIPASRLNDNITKHFVGPTKILSYLHGKIDKNFDLPLKYGTGNYKNDHGYSWRCLQKVNQMIGEEHQIIHEMLNVKPSKQTIFYRNADKKYVPATKAVFQKYCRHEIKAIVHNGKLRSRIKKLEAQLY